MWRQQLLTMPAFPDANKDRSAVNMSSPLKIVHTDENICASWTVHVCVTFQNNMLIAPHIDTVCVETSYRSAFIMHTHKPSMTECKRDAKATWAVGPHCNLTQNGSGDRMSFLPIE